MNDLFYSIVISNILLILTIFSNNYFLINIIKFIPSISISLISISLVSFMLGYIISINSSNKNCKRNNKIYALKMGFKTTLHSIIGYMLVYFVSFIRNPFLEIFGNKELGYSIAQSFLVVLNTISATIINYYSSINISCKVPQNIIDKNLKELDKYLNKKNKNKTKQKKVVKN